MPGAQVAETTYTPAGWEHEPLRLIVRRVPFSAKEDRRRQCVRPPPQDDPPDQLALALDGQIASLFGYRFILTDIPVTAKTATEVEHFHRHRAQIEERLKDATLGQAPRHLPCGNIDANRVWLTCALLALNLTA